MGKISQLQLDECENRQEESEEDILSFDELGVVHEQDQTKEQS